MNNIDATDEHIMTLLEQNARQSSEMIAKQVNVSSATVRRRLKRLVNSDLLHIVAFRDPIKAGLPLAALIGLNIDHHLINSVMQAIRDWSEVVWACTTTGRFDAIVLVRFKSNEDFSLFLRTELTGITGIKDSETFLCLHVEKRGHLC